MTDLKERWERAIGEVFFAWFNPEQHTGWVFREMGSDPPDLIYSYGAQTLPVEISSAFNSDSQAAALGQWARGSASPRGFDVFNPDETLIENLNRTLLRKCLSSPNPASFLVICMYPDLTPIKDFENVRGGISIPGRTPTKGFLSAVIFQVP